MSVEREVLVQTLSQDKHFLFLFDLLRQFHLQSYVYYEQTGNDPTHLWEIQDQITERILSECRLFMDEYDLFLNRNGLTYDSSPELIEKAKREQGFTENHASREPFEELLSFYAGEQTPYTKEQIIKQLVYWDENLLFGGEVEKVDFHFEEPRFGYRSFMFTPKKRKE